MFAAKLRNWTIALGINAPHAGKLVLLGTAYEHTHWDVKDGDPVRTNAIVRFEGDVGVTLSGSRYILEGPPCQDFNAWVEAQPIGFRLVVKGNYIEASYPPRPTATVN